MTTDPRRASVRDFLQTCVVAEPKARDYADAGLDGAINSAARRWVGVVRKAARPTPSGRDGQRAAELVEEAADALVAALPDEWELPTEDPTELANRIPRS